MFLSISFVCWTAYAWVHPGVESAALPPEAAVEGKKVWLKKNCMTCHQQFGLGGYLGPDLTDALERRGEKYVRWILRHGRGEMPDLELEEADITRLIAFLEYMGRTGDFPPKADPLKGFNN